MSTASTLVVFAHGKESGPWGSKIRHLADVATRLGAEAISPDYSDLDDPQARVMRLLALSFPHHRKLVLVGSSMGGYVSIVASRQLRPAGLFLMAPAMDLPGYPEASPMHGSDDLEVVMGWRDEVIAPASIVEYARQYAARLHLLNADHRLGGVLPEVGELFRRFLDRVISEGDQSVGHEAQSHD